MDKRDTSLMEKLIFGQMEYLWALEWPEKVNQNDYVFSETDKLSMKSKI